jgi:type IV pilus biogenesis protein PilP
MKTPAPKHFALLIGTGLITHAVMAADSAPDAADPTAVPRGVLEQMSALQANINILDLQVKQAELQAKLAGLKGLPTPGGEPKTAMPAALPAPAPVSLQPMVAAPVVESIRGSADTLVANIITPDGATIPATVGSILPNGWRIITIDGNGVAVATLDGQPSRLPFGAGRQTAAPLPGVPVPHLPQ